MKLLLSANHLHTKTPSPPHSKLPSIAPLKTSQISFSLKPISASSSSSSSFSSSLSSPATAAAATIPSSTQTPQPLLPNWGEFTGRVSGEWDGFGADFTPAGVPVELPENVVPEAYREWEVKVYDWQTQCPTLASEESGAPILSYQLVRLLPTVGCEADAATRHSVEHKIAGGPENGVVGLGYSASGSYVAVWGVKGFGGKRLLEVEHCLVDPRDKEVRVRVVMVVAPAAEGMTMEGVRVFSEQWYGPWRNGEQLGGCAVRESGFAASERVDIEAVAGVWEGRSLSVATFGKQCKEVIHEMRDATPKKSIRDREIVALPKNLWCVLKQKEDGETCGQVGWLLGSGVAMSSQCVFLADGTLKDMAIAQESGGLD